MSYLQETSEAKWRLQTEYIIAGVQFAFAMFIFALYFGFNSSLGASHWLGLTRWAVVLFPLICLGRLAYVYWGKPGDVFGWISMAVDIAFLTTIIFIFSLQYGTSAASLKAPSFTYYFIFVAMHAMRFRVNLVIASGVISAIAWGGILGFFILSGAPLTRSYAEYISSPSILVGAEVEKIVGLLAFTIMLAIGGKRAGEALQDAAQKQISEVKMHEAEKTARLKTDFLANMSHEIRTPMNGVLGMAQVLSHTELNDQQSSYVDTIQRSGDALLTIINDILDFSKIESGKLRLEAVPFDLRHACEDVVSLLGVTARAKGIELILNINPSAPIQLLGDPGRIRQVLTNLIGNAIKFTEKGYVLCEVDGVISDGQAHLSFDIQDTGIGIEAAQIDAIFKKFTQADSSTTRRFGGTGLGLSISKSLVTLMGGELRATSKVGEGAKFSFTANIQLDRRKRQNKAPAKEVDLSEISILVLDDLEVNSEILRLQLKQFGALPHFANNARDAVNAIVQAHKAGSPFAIVITDYQMPDIDGLKFVQALRKHAAFDELQIIVLSSIDDPNAKRMFNQCNVASYMTKPCRQTDLKNAVYLAATKYKTKGLIEMAKEHRPSVKPYQTETGQTKVS